MKHLRYLALFVIVLLASCKADSSPKQVNTSKPAPQISTSEVGRWTSTPYRDQHWKPAEGKYYFSETWTWSYLNENLPTDDANHSGEMTIYVDPPTGTMLLRKGDSYNYGEMIDWMIIEPSGQYITHWTDHDGSEHIERDSMQGIDDFDFYMTYQSKEFNANFKALNEFTTFGKNDDGRPDFYAEQFQQSFSMSSDTSYVYMTSVPFSVRPLFFANSINEDLGLPILFDAYGYILPDSMLPLEEKMDFNGTKVEYSFQSIYPTEYFIDLAE